MNIEIYILDSLYYQTKNKKFSTYIQNFPKNFMRWSLQLTNCLAISSKSNLSVLCLYMCNTSKLLYLLSATAFLVQDLMSLCRKRYLPCSYMLMGANK